jgi:hypothetical protein
MKKLPRIIGHLSKVLYWLSMATALVAAIVFLLTPERQLSYAFALISVVSMGSSSLLLYGKNLISVGKEITAPNPKSTKGKSKKNA